MKSPSKKLIAAMIGLAIILASVLTLLTSQVDRIVPPRDVSNISCCVETAHTGWPLVVHETSTDGAGVVIISSTYSAINVLLNVVFYLSVSGIMIFSVYSLIAYIRS